MDNTSPSAANLGLEDLTVSEVAPPRNGFAAVCGSTCSPGTAPPAELDHLKSAVDLFREMFRENRDLYADHPTISAIFANPSNFWFNQGRAEEEEGEEEGSKAAGLPLPPVPVASMPPNGKVFVCYANTPSGVLQPVAVARIASDGLGEATQGERGEAMVMGLYVRPDWRGRGLACWLMKSHVLGACRDMGFAKVSLSTGDRQAAAISLYEKKLGFGRTEPPPKADVVEGEVFFSLDLK